MFTDDAPYFADAPLELRAGGRSAIFRGDVPAEQVEPGRRELGRNHGIVKKLGGDPTKPAFGL